MNSHKPFIPAVLLCAALYVACGTPVSGQTFTLLHDLRWQDEGAGASGGLVLDGDTLYGTCGVGTATGYGSVFKMKTNGTGFTVLKTFTGQDGKNPGGTLLLDNGVLYGATSSGGTNDAGTVFKISTNGTGFVVLKHFPTLTVYQTNSDGARPNAGLVLSGNTLYGTAAYGGPSYSGTIFRLNTDGSEFSVLKSLSNSDGSRPYAPLLFSEGVLYGTASAGGSFGYGTIFKLSTNGSGFTVLKTFSDSTNGLPKGGLLMDGSTLYGCGYASVYKLGLDGSGFEMWTYFTAAYNNGTGVGTNSSGFDSRGTLVLQRGTLIGSAYSGGRFGFGTIFSMGTNGQGFTVWKTFANISQDGFHMNAEGANPVAGLVAGGNSFYGTTTYGSWGGWGSIISITVEAPAITNQPVSVSTASGDTVTLSVGATGTAPLTLQWMLNGTNLIGATQSTLTLSNASAMAGNYSVLVQNAAGSVTSQTAVVTGVDLHMLASVYVNGPIGSNYLIQAKPTVDAAWATLTNVALPTQPYIYVDFNSVTNNQQFYRAIPQ